jgi:hypothetical protein
MSTRSDGNAGRYSIFGTLQAAGELPLTKVRGLQFQERE